MNEKFLKKEWITINFAKWVIRIKAYGSITEKMGYKICRRAKKGLLQIRKDPITIAFNTKNISLCCFANFREISQRKRYFIGIQFINRERDIPTD